MTLRGMLKRDFGIDLPVGDGTGTRVDPLLVLIDDPSELPRVAEMALWLIMRGQSGSGREEIFWRIVGRDLLEHDGKTLFKLDYEKYILKPEMIETESVSKFFYTPDIKLSKVPEPYIIHSDPKLSLSLPFNLSWLKYQDFKDYEPDEPMMGYSIGYGGPRVKVTLYVYSYPQGVPAHEAVKREIDSTMQQLRGSFSAARPFSDEAFSPEAVGVELRLDEGQHGLVLIDRVGSKLFKWRVTWFEDERRILLEAFIRHSYQLMRQTGDQHGTSAGMPATVQ